MALLAFALDSENDNAFLFLLPFCIIIPMSGRIAYYRKAMAKLFAYLIVFHEADEKCEYKWETANMHYYNIFGSQKGFSLRYYECFIISIVCIILFLWHYSSSTSPNTFHFVWPFSLLLWEFYTTLQINRVDKDRLDFIDEWKLLKAQGDISCWHSHILKP